MSPELLIQTRIAQIKASGKVAPPNTWIGTTSVTKKGKRYTYYRLMKAVPSAPREDNPNPSPKTKMVNYLGSADSQAYKEMKAAIARRNEIQRLERKLSTLNKTVSADKPKAKQPPELSALTNLVMEVVKQVEGLQAEVAWLKRQLT